MGLWSFAVLAACAVAIDWLTLTQGVPTSARIPGGAIVEREVFKAVSVAVVRTVNEYHKADKDALELAKKKNIPVVQPDPSLAKEREAFVEKDLPGIIKNAEDKLGIKNAKEFVSKYKELIAKYDGLVKPIENDPAKLSALLYTEIFAKLDPKTYGVKK